MTAAPEYRITALRMGTLTVDSTVLVMGHGAARRSRPWAGTGAATLGRWPVGAVRWSSTQSGGSA
jgi:hypothetical protein